MNYENLDYQNLNIEVTPNKVQKLELVEESVPEASANLTDEKKADALAIGKKNRQARNFIEADTVKFELPVEVDNTVKNAGLSTDEIAEIVNQDDIFTVNSVHNANPALKSFKPNAPITANVTVDGSYLDLKAGGKTENQKQFIDTYPDWEDHLATKQNIVERADAMITASEYGLMKTPIVGVEQTEGIDLSNLSEEELSQ